MLYKKLALFLLLISSVFATDRLDIAFLSDFDKSRIFVELSGDKNMTLHSLYHLSKEWDRIKEDILSLKIIDRATSKLVDALKAHYLVNSNLNSPFEKYSKFAFLDLQDAKRYQKMYGGDIRTLFFTLSLSKSDAKKFDDERFENYLKNRVYRAGSFIRENFCKDTTDIETNCPHLDLDGMIALSQTTKSNNLENRRDKNVIIDKSIKCPVCGMFVHKYPDWVAKITTKDGKSWYFDGAKDMFKFYFEPKRYLKSVDFDLLESEIMVMEYYSLESLDARNLFFVVDSSIFGPMGRELIPFKSQEDALLFIKSYGGELFSFEEITLELVWGLDL